MVLVERVHEGEDRGRGEISHRTHRLGHGGEKREEELAIAALGAIGHVRGTELGLHLRSDRYCGALRGPKEDNR